MFLTPQRGRKPAAGSAGGPASVTRTPIAVPAPSTLSAAVGRVDFASDDDLSDSEGQSMLLRARKGMHQAGAAAGGGGIRTPLGGYSLNVHGITTLEADIVKPKFFRNRADDYEFDRTKRTQLSSTVASLLHSPPPVSLSPAATSPANSNSTAAVIVADAQSPAFQASAANFGLGDGPKLGSFHRGHNVRRVRLNGLAKPARLSSPRSVSPVQTNTTVRGPSPPTSPALVIHAPEAIDDITAAASDAPTPIDHASDFSRPRKSSTGRPVSAADHVASESIATPDRASPAHPLAGDRGNLANAGVLLSNTKPRRKRTSLPGIEQTPMPTVVIPPTSAAAAAAVAASSSALSPLTPMEQRHFDLGATSFVTNLKIRPTNKPRRRLQTDDDDQEQPMLSPPPVELAEYRAAPDTFSAVTMETNEGAPALESHYDIDSSRSDAQTSGYTMDALAVPDPTIYTMAPLVQEEHAFSGFESALAPVPIDQSIETHDTTFRPEPEHMHAPIPIVPWHQGDTQRQSSADELHLPAPETPTEPVAEPTFVLPAGFVLPADAKPRRSSTELPPVVVHSARRLSLSKTFPVDVATGPVATPLVPPSVVDAASAMRQTASRASSAASTTAPGDFILPALAKPASPALEAASAMRRSSITSSPIKIVDSLAAAAPGAAMEAAAAMRRRPSTSTSSGGLGPVAAIALRNSTRALFAAPTPDSPLPAIQPPHDLEQQQSEPPQRPLPTHPTRHTSPAIHAALEMRHTDRAPAEVPYASQLRPLTAPVHIVDMAQLQPCIQCSVNEAHAAHFAAYHGHLQCLEILIERNLEDVVDDTGRTPLFYAAARNHPDCCACLIDVRSGWLDAGDNNGDTALHVASCRGHEDVVELLLQSGATASLANHQGLTPSHVASTNKILEQLCFYGAPLNVMDNEGRSPLFTMCATGRTTAASCLCELDTQMLAINLPDCRGDTPLHAAACNGHIDCVWLLLRNGVRDVEQQNHAGLSALDLAVLNHHEDCMMALVQFGAQQHFAPESVPAEQEPSPRDLPASIPSTTPPPDGRPLVAIVNITPPSDHASPSPEQATPRRQQGGRKKGKRLWRKGFNTINAAQRLVEGGKLAEHARIALQAARTEAGQDVGGEPATKPRKQRKNKDAKAKLAELSIPTVHEPPGHSHHFSEAIVSPQLRPAPIANSGSPADADSAAAASASASAPASPPTPNVTAAALASPAAASPPTPSSAGATVSGTEWTQCFDPATGRIYYFNPQTNVSQWEVPEDIMRQAGIGGGRKPFKSGGTLASMRALAASKSSKQLDVSGSSPGQASLSSPGSAFTGSPGSPPGTVSLVVTGSKLQSNAGSRRNSRHKSPFPAPNSPVLTPSHAAAIAAAASISMWVQRYDPASGYSYYENTTTGESQWDPPAGWAPPPT